MALKVVDRGRRARFNHGGNSSSLRGTPACLRGLEGVEIAERLGGTAEGQRKQFERATKRVAEELGPEELLP